MKIEETFKQMEMIFNYEEIKSRISENPKNLPSINELHLEIWERNQDHIVLVISAIHRNPLDKRLKMYDYDTFDVADLNIRCESISDLKEYGQKLKKKLQKDYKDIKVTSNLRYR